MAGLFPAKTRPAFAFAKSSFLVAFLAVALVSHAPLHALAEGPDAVGSAEGASGATGVGDNTSANQSSNFSATADTSGGQYGATGDASTDANAQQSTGGSTSTASAQTGTEATADNLGGVYQADATAEASGQGTVGAQSKSGDITATASASGGTTPAASASTSRNNVVTTSATAAYHQAGTYYCSSACTTGYSKQTGKKTISIAVLEDAYSLAVASKKSAYAKAGAFNDFTKKEQKTITRSLSVGVYAKANQKSARSVALANAFSLSSPGKKNSGKFTGFTQAGAYAKATACVGGNCVAVARNAKAATAAKAYGFAIIRDCDRTPRSAGNFAFSSCQYKVVAR